VHSLSINPAVGGLLPSIEQLGVIATVVALVFTAALLVAGLILLATAKDASLWAAIPSCSNGWRHWRVAQQAGSSAAKWIARPRRTAR
jgi:hypothetical protein